MEEDENMSWYERLTRDMLGMRGGRETSQVVCPTQLKAIRRPPLTGTDEAAHTYYTAALLVG